MDHRAENRPTFIRKKNIGVTMQADDRGVDDRLWERHAFSLGIKWRYLRGSVMPQCWFNECWLDLEISDSERAYVRPVFFTYNCWHVCFSVTHQLYATTKKKIRDESYNDLTSGLHIPSNFGFDSFNHNTFVALSRDPKFWSRDPERVHMSEISGPSLDSTLL